MGNGSQELEKRKEGIGKRKEGRGKRPAKKTAGKR